MGEQSDSVVTGSIKAILTMAHREHKVTVENCLDELGESSIALALLLFTLLSSLPLFGIPGFTTVTGIPIILLGGQLLFGAEHLWLPRRINRHPLHSPKLWHWLERILPLLQKIEQYIKPRFLTLSENPARRLLGAAFVVMGILLALPIPLINFPAGFSMFILALGLVERDGFIIIAGLAMIGLLLAAMLVMAGNIATLGIW